MNTTTNQKSNRIVPIIMMIALFGMISFVTNLAAPMGQVLKEQFAPPTSRDCWVIWQTSSLMPSWVSPVESFCSAWAIRKLR